MREDGILRQVYIVKRVPITIARWSATIQAIDSYVEPGSADSENMLYFAYTESEVLAASMIFWQATTRPSLR